MKQISDRDIEDTREPPEYPTCPICDAPMEFSYWTKE
jgi:hypothetical protein